MKDWIVKKALKTWEKHDQKILSNQQYPEKIEEITDIPYMEDLSPEHRLDIYCPQKKNKDRLPVIINIHGGGFVYGDKKINRLYCHHLATHQFVVFNINYRLAPKTKVPSQIQDIVAAMQWISLHLEKYQGDKEQVYIVGESAGGFFALLVSMIIRSKRLQDIFEVKPVNLIIQKIGVNCGMITFDEFPGFWFLRLLSFEKGYKDALTYQNMRVKELPELDLLPPLYLLTVEDDLLKGLTLSFAKIARQRNLLYKLRYVKTKEEKLGHIFSVLKPTLSISREVTQEMIDYFLEKSNYKK